MALLRSACFRGKVPVYRGSVSKTPVKGDPLKARLHFLKFKQIDSVTYVSPGNGDGNFRVNFSGDMLCPRGRGTRFPASFRLSFRDDYRTPAELHGLLDALQRENAYDEVQAPTDFVDKSFHLGNSASWFLAWRRWSPSARDARAHHRRNAVKLSLFSRNFSWRI